MVKMPFDCASNKPSGIALAKTPNVNCLDYSTLFTVTDRKKLSPNPSLTINKPYCHEIQGVPPLLVINCKLAPCNAIKNTSYRRPGVNCLADCNLPEGGGVGKSGIGKNDFYIEGFNCLRSCDSTPNPSYGVNCVLKHKNFVMPLCSASGVANAPFYNLATNNLDSRMKCINYDDMRICGQSESGNHLKTCVNQGVNGGFVINPDVTRKCYHGYTNANCVKISCSNLAKEELSVYVNSFNSIALRSDNNYCIADEYTNFSFDQIDVNSSLTDSNKKFYLTNYTLPSKPCEKSHLYLFPSF
jgi:hypothetical protein